MGVVVPPQFLEKKRGGDEASADLSQLTAEFDKLAPQIKQAITGRPELRTQLGPLVTAFQGHMKTPNEAGAKDALQKIVAALKLATSNTTPKTEESEAHEIEHQEKLEHEEENHAGEEQEWLKTFARIEPRYLEVIKTHPENEAKLRFIMTAASDLAGEEKFGEAIARISMLTPLLKPNAEGSAPVRFGYKGIVAYRKSLVKLRHAISIVNTQIQGLKRAIPAHDSNETQLADDLVEALTAITDRFNEAVDDAMSTSENEDTPITRQLAEEFGIFSSEVETNSLILHVDSNPYQKTTIQSTLGAALASVGDAMPAVA
jgi:hypothetical protein